MKTFIYGIIKAVISPAAILQPFRFSEIKLNKALLIALGLAISAMGCACAALILSMGIAMLIPIGIAILVISAPIVLVVMVVTKFANNRVQMSNEEDKGKEKEVVEIQLSAEDLAKLKPLITRTVKESFDYLIKRKSSS